MKIAFWHFYTFRLHRGIETLVLSLSNELSKRGHEVSIIAASPTLKPLVAPLPNVKVHTFPTMGYFEHSTIVPFYAHHFLNFNYDHVITFFSDFGEGAAESFVSLFKKLPLSLYLCYPPSNVPHRYEAFKRYGWDKKARHIWADARWISKEAESVLGRKIPVIPVGTDTDRFTANPQKRRQMREKFGYTDKETVLLNVSALESRKGVEHVLKAMSRLKLKCPSLRYFILGKGPDETKLKEMTRELKLESHVIFGGETSELEAYYSMADIFVMLSEGEANSVACHEAMSCGLPVVVSNTGGFLEDVPEGKGVLVDPDRADAVDNALLKLAINPEERRVLGARARDYIKEFHTWERAGEKFTQLLTPKASELLPSRSLLQRGMTAAPKLMRSILKKPLERFQPGIDAPILCYHQVGDETETDFPSLYISKADFENQIRWFSQKGYRFISLTDLTEKIKTGRPLKEKSVVLTFDDGYEGIYHHAFPVLKKYQCRATLFLIAGQIGKKGDKFDYLTREQVKELAENGIELASHSFNHRSLTELSTEELKDELHSSKKRIEEIGGRTVNAFCYPFGHFNEEVSREVQRAGYQSACSSRMGRRHTLKDLFALKRIGINFKQALPELEYRLEVVSRAE